MNKKLKLEELNRISVDKFKFLEKHPIVVVLDNIRSAYNIGSVFRTADALALEKIYLCGITATPPHREIYKTALGATDSVEWQYEQETLDAVNHLKQKGYMLLCLEQVENSVMLQDFTPQSNRKYALIVGNEVDGVMQQVVNNSDVCIEIPQFGTKHSLNVSVSAGMALWDILWKIKKA